jgi:hypothetical protein
MACIRKISFRSGSIVREVAEGKAGAVLQLLGSLTIWRFEKSTNGYAEECGSVIGNNGKPPGAGAEICSV